MKRRKRKIASGKLFGPSERQQHAWAYKHAKAVFASQTPREPTNAERKRTGRAFSARLTTEQEDHVVFTFHLDPLFRVSCTAVPGIAGCTAKPIQTRLQMIRALVRGHLSDVLDFRSFSLLTAALSFDPSES